MTITGATHIADGHNGKVENSILHPEEVGLTTTDMAAIKGGATAAESATQVRSVLGGEPGAKLDMVLLNAGTALMAAGKADSIVAGIGLAREVIGSGAALAKLEQLVKFSRG